MLQNKQPVRVGICRYLLSNSKFTLNYNNNSNSSSNSMHNNIMQLINKWCCLSNSSSIFSNSNSRFWIMPAHSKMEWMLSSYFSSFRWISSLFNNLMRELFSCSRNNSSNNNITSNGRMLWINKSSLHRLILLYSRSQNRPIN